MVGAGCTSDSSIDNLVAVSSRRKHRFEPTWPCLIIIGLKANRGRFANGNNPETAGLLRIEIDAAKPVTVDRIGRTVLGIFVHPGSHFVVPVQWPVLETYLVWDIGERNKEKREEQPEDIRYTETTAEKDGTETTPSPQRCTRNISPRHGVIGRLTFCRELASHGCTLEPWKAVRREAATPALLRARAPIPVIIQRRIMRIGSVSPGSGPVLADDCCGIGIHTPCVISDPLLYVLIKAK